MKTFKCKSCGGQSETRNHCVRIFGVTQLWDKDLRKWYTPKTEPKESNESK
jgi:hypothetical protein